MKSILVRASLVLGVLAVAAVGCQTQGEEGSIDEEMIDEDVAEAEAAIEGATIVEKCPDLKLTEVKYEFCGFQNGPLDDSPIHVKCTRQCTIERSVSFTPAIPPAPSWTCVTDGTTCGPWQCPSCD